MKFYDADDEGNIVFSKELKNGRGIYYLKRGRTKAQILKEIPVPHNIGIWPRITNNGKGIFFSVPTAPRGTRVYTILIKLDGCIGSVGEVNKLTDVDFAVDTFNRELPDIITLLPEVETLPDINGSGLCFNLY